MKKNKNIYGKQMKSFLYNTVLTFFLGGLEKSDEPIFIFVVLPLRSHFFRAKIQNIEFLKSDYGYMYIKPQKNELTINS